MNTGAFDPFTPLIDIARRRDAWVHVDGAFGLWARAAGGLRALADGVERADSWGVDAHKWLNVPYDSGIAIVAHPAAHRASMAQRASYLLRADGERRDGMDWTPEASRRARAVPVYAVLKALGREGVAALVTGNCERARQMAERLRPQDGITILNDVVLNQVLVRVRSRVGRERDAGGDRPRAARRRVLGGRHDLGEGAGDADRDLELVDAPRRTSTRPPPRSVRRRRASL